MRYNIAVTNVAVRFDWHQQGQVRLDATGLLTFPHVGREPGAYRFLADDGTSSWGYVGEAADIRRRWMGYRAPGPSQRTNLRVAAEMAAMFSNGGWVTAEIATDASVTVDGLTIADPLRSRAGRLLVEQAAILQAQSAGLILLNG